MATTKPDESGTDDGSRAEETELAEDTLADFADSWMRADGLAEQAEITAVTSEICRKRIDREMMATETRETTQLVPSTHESYLEDRVLLKDRYERPREEFIDDTIEYVSEAASIDACDRCGGDGQQSCPTCNTGKVTCSTCSGSGMESCSQCSGWLTSGGAGRIDCPDCSDGTVKNDGESMTCGACNGAGHVMCNSCSGNGEHRCTDCGGGGKKTCGTCGGSTIVTCRRCQGEQELVTADTGSIELSSTEDVTAESRMTVPSTYITSETGARVDGDETWHGIADLESETLIREQTEYRGVDVTKIQYRYEDSTYDLFEVEGEIRARSYPKSSARRLLSVALALVVIGLLGYGVYLLLL